VQIELRTYLADNIIERAEAQAGYEKLIADIAAKRITPMDGAEKLLAQLGIKDR